MHISDQPHPPSVPPHAYDDQIVPPAPVASVAHVSESDDWNPIVPNDSTWTPRGRRATHRVNGKH